MHFEVKYVVGVHIDAAQGVRLEAVVFARSLMHSSAAAAVSRGRIVGAGFARIRPTADGKSIEVEVYGESESLNVKCSELDKLYVERALGIVENSGWMDDAEFRKAQVDAAMKIIDSR